MTKHISIATKRNFDKLNKDLSSHKFISRANKLDSKKTIIPIEYYSNIENVSKINSIIDEIANNDISLIIDNLIISLFKRENLVYFDDDTIKSRYKYVQEFVSELKYEKNLSSVELPIDECDPIGIVYQQIISEGEKNKKGSYYTPKSIVNTLLNVKNKKDDVFCDPCCGTGMFLMKALETFKPENIFGYDIDNIAVKIARANMFLKFPNVNYVNNIQCCNFLTLNKNEKFNYIITNPPWGSYNNSNESKAFSCVTSNESFSYFIEHSLRHLLPHGILHFLLPISILNVKLHSDIRKIIVDNYKIEEINMFGKCFKGVLTDVVSLKLSTKFLDEYSYKISNQYGKTMETPISFVRANNNYNILLLNTIDIPILNKICKRECVYLSEAKFALGIVTGNNQNQLKNCLAENLRPIITGKEIQKYYMKDAKYFIEYNRRNFQQVCADTFFEADSKFIYKFISRKLVFALDEEKTLTLNTANIMLVPKDFKLSKYVLLAILNSDILNYYFIKMINQVKVLKEHIQNLPLPLLPIEIQDTIEKMVINIIKNKSDSYESVEQLLFSYYNFSLEEIQRIKEVVYGRID